MWFVCLVVKLCPTLCKPKDSSLSGFSVHGIFQARILDWVAISFSKMWLWLTICIFFLILSWLRASLLHWSIWPVSYKKKMITRKYTSSYFVPHFLAPTKKKNYFLLFFNQIQGNCSFFTVHFHEQSQKTCCVWNEKFGFVFLLFCSPNAIITIK